MFRHHIKRSFIFVVAGLALVSSLVAPLTATAATTATLKKPIVGLVDRSGPATSGFRIPPNEYLPAVNAIVVNARWADLQTAKGAPLTENNIIDQAITAVRAKNKEMPGLNMKLRLRVYAGAHSPEWAKSLEGTPVAYTDGFDSKSVTIPRYWTSKFKTEYNNLQKMLAAKYDAIPELAEVTISRCSMVYPETFIRGASIASNVTNLRAAGYTLNADKQCIYDQINAHNVWQRTPSILALNPYQVINNDGTTTSDVKYTVSAMDTCRKILGTRCVLANYSIRTPLDSLGTSYKTMYDAIVARRGKITYQTAVTDRIGDWRATLDMGTNSLRGNSIELVQDYIGTYPASEVAAYDSSLEYIALRR